MKCSTIDVNAEQPYQVVIGTGLCSMLPEYLYGSQRVAMIYPTSMADRVIGLVAGLEQEILLIEVPDAESAKTAPTLIRCWDLLAEAGFTRSDAIVGFGGGSTTDLAGFVAATWLRGVRYVAIPTTVLGMVDAAVGGKTGINLGAGKNLVGAFYEPYTVLCDMTFLRTLPIAEVRSGLSEIVKAGFIADPLILAVLEGNPARAFDPDGDALASLIRQAIMVKAAVVTADLRERTSVGSDVGREVLNYGHTLGHAIERHEDYRIRHGEAVSIGMCFAAEVSRRLKVLDDSTADRHFAVLRSLGLPTAYDPTAWPALREAMNLDKKTRGSSLRLVILESLGRPCILTGPDEDLLADAFAALSVGRSPA